MNYIQPLKEIPAKSEIAEYVQQYKDQDGLSYIEKYANLKFLEEFVKTGLAELKGDAKDDFIKMFNGAMKMDFMGVTVQLKNMAKANTLKDPSYEYPKDITDLENEIKRNELLIKDDIIKMFNGAMKINIMVITVQLKNMTKDNNLKDHSYQTTKNITDL